MGKRDLFEKYYQENYLQVLRYVIKKIGNIESAEDMVMEVFVVCYQKLDEFDESKASFATWLYVILNNRIKNYYRDRKIGENLQDNDAEAEGHEDECVSAMYLDEMRVHLAKALETLPEIQRKIVIYKYFKEKSSVEIAELLEMSSGNARVQLTRGLKRLKDYFDEKGIQWEM